MIQRISIVLAAVALATTLASCGGDTPASVACSPTNPPEEGTTQHRITFDGTERSYVVHVPPEDDGQTRLPVVFLFHGVGDNAGSLLSATGMDRRADEEGFVVVAPEGSDSVPAWTFRPRSDEPASDVRYVHELLDRVKETTCVDNRRVFAAGFSNGATLTLALACEKDRDFAAFAAVSGPYYEPYCDDAPPRSIIYFHGARDPVLPFSGAETILGRLPGVTDALTDWADHAECRRPARTSAVSPGVRHHLWTGCDRGAAVSAYVLAEGGHSWPGWVGADPDEIRATDVIWDFFSEHALP